MPELTEDERQQLRGSLMVLRIIVCALLLGVTSYTGFCLFLHLRAGKLPQQLVVIPGQLTIPQAIAMASAVVAGVLALLVPPFLIVPQLKPDSEYQRLIEIQSAAQTIQVRTIVACALLEGAAFFNAIFVQLDFSRGNLAMVLALLVVMASHFPLSSWYFGKIERLMSR
ncbi:hypothetical protein [Anatilimnocola floriformis]|uniref:hypothetical protein n=1 Tax=Anatilimnocola floriformis TaxID=2948575 RepID=UPI0020C4D358|nr:hypothetical protein [Anatilimnocola floriformis]